MAIVIIQSIHVRQICFELAAAKPVKPDHFGVRWPRWLIYRAETPEALIIP